MSENADSLKKRESTIIKTSLLGILANVLLVIGKSIVGFIAGSIAIVMDAVNNLTDVLSSTITIIGTKLSAWSWKAQLAFGVRVGAGRDRLERALGKSIEPSELPADLRKNKLPRWLTDFFWSPK